MDGRVRLLIVLVSLWTGCVDLARPPMVLNDASLDRASLDTTRDATHDLGTGQDAPAPDRPRADVGPPSSDGPATNIAPAGTAYRWSMMEAATDDSNRIASRWLNDGDQSDEFSLNTNGDDIANAWEAGGIIWPADHKIVAVEYVNGSWAPGGNGGFVANFQLQMTTNGSTWQSAPGFVLAPPYDYDSVAFSGKTYGFTNPSGITVRGVRVIGQVRLPDSLSWHANAREILVQGY